MARKKLDPRGMYADVIPLLELAWRNGSAMCPTDNAAAATALVHRLNRARAALRETEDNFSFDRFVIRGMGTRTHGEVTIEPRQTIDYSKVTTVDGRPIEIPYEPTDEESQRMTTATLKAMRDGSYNPSRPYDVLDPSDPLRQRFDPPKLAEHEALKDFLDGSTKKDD